MKIILTPREDIKNPNYSCNSLEALTVELTGRDIALEKAD